MRSSVKSDQLSCKTFDVRFWLCFLLFVTASAIICYLPSQLVKEGFCDFRETGQIGDTIDGIMGPFIAIAAAGLTFIAFWVQYKANIMQRNDIALERFERNFYELLNLQESITNSLVLEGINHKDQSKNLKETGRDVFQMMYEIPNIVWEKSKKIEDGSVKTRKTYKGLKGLFEKEHDALKCYAQLPIVGYLDHYFRHLYWIFKFIDSDKNLSDEAKYTYACIARSSLSQHELVILFYNGLSENGAENFKPLIEKYALMNNLRKELLARPEHINRYDESAYRHC